MAEDNGIPTDAFFGWARESVRFGDTVLDGFYENIAENRLDQLREAGVQMEVPPMNYSAGVSFQVQLVLFGDSKVRIILAAREITGLGLRDFKALVENIGVVIESIYRERRRRSRPN